MPKSQLLQMALAGDVAGFENRCLDLLQSGLLRVVDVSPALAALIEKGAPAGDVRNLLGVILENLPDGTDPRHVIELVRVCLAADPDHAGLRQQLVDAYRAAYGAEPGFDVILDASGLLAGRPFRNSCKVLDFAFMLQPGDFLLNRMDDHAAEVVDVDRSSGLFTLRREGRRVTLPATDLARSFDRVDADDFRVLRQLHPERLPELIANDPVALVIGLIHAHGEHIDQDMLRDELVPRYLDAKAWSKWWTSTRAKLKQHKHIIMEGRAPIVLSYSRAGQTFEDETREAFAAAREPQQWRQIIEGYVREVQGQGATPDAALLAELGAKLAERARAARRRRPAEALATALVLRQLAEKGLVSDSSAHNLALEVLGDGNAERLFGTLDDAQLWNAGLDVVAAARPNELPGLAARLMGIAPAALLDRLAVEALRGGQAVAAQDWIERALDDPVNHPELIYWLWKGPQDCPGLRFPPADHLLDEILDTLAAIGRTLQPPAAVTRVFRQRMKAVLALRDHRRVRACFQTTDVNRGVTLRNVLLRIEGLGDNAQQALIGLLREVHPELWVRPEKPRLEPWEDEYTIWATDAGLQRRTAERDEIVNVQMRDNARRIGEAASHGDLSENSEYKFALEERDLLRARVAQINNELSVARTLDPYMIDTARVTIGTRVTLRDMASDERRVMTFLGPFETDIERGVFNYRAPVSQKLMGLRVGEHATLTIDGADVQWEVVTIENGLLDGGAAAGAATG